MNFDKIMSYVFFPTIIIGIIFIGRGCYQLIDLTEKIRLDREKLFEEKCAPLGMIHYENLYRKGFYSVICANENGENKRIYVKVFNNGQN